MSSFVSRPSKRCGHILGFTLLEVLIALAVLAVSSLAIMRQTGQSMSQLEQLQLKTIATVVAENHVTTLQLLPQWPDTGRSDHVVTFNDISWLINTNVSSTSDLWLRKIEVTVALDDTPDYSLVHLITYRGLH